MNTGDFFSRFLFYSLLVHIAVIMYIILDPLSEIFSKKNVKIKNAIRVDSIGLPELKQIHQQTLAAQKKQQKLKKPVEKKPLVAIKKSVKPVEKKPPAVKKDPVKQVQLKKSKPKKKEEVVDTIRKEQNQAMDKIKKLEEIEQKQDQAIEKLEVMESINKIKQELESPKYVGAKLSKGNAQDGEVVTDFQMLQYFTSVRAHINMYWSLPQELADKNLRAKIYTEINNEGTVLKGRIMQSSGNEDFDARVLNTIERASPLPKPPTKEIEKLLSKGVVFNFPE